MLRQGTFECTLASRLAIDHAIICIATDALVGSKGWSALANSTLRVDIFAIRVAHCEGAALQQVMDAT